MTNKINSFFINSFEFENYPCICRKESVYSSPNEEPTYIIKVCANTYAQPLKFSYSSQVGLSLSGNAGGIIEENILGKLLAIPSFDLDETIKFVEKYGFIFPITDSSFESIDANTLLIFFERLKLAVLLMSDIARKKNYPSIFEKITYLLFSNSVTFKSLENTYTTNEHEFTHLIHSYCTMPDIQRNQELFDTGYISKYDLIKGDIVKISKDDIVNMISGKGFTNLEGSKDPLFKNIFALYTNFPSDNLYLHLIIDFYYNYQKEIGVVDWNESRKIQYYKKRSSEISDRLKHSMIEVAKVVISEEINYNIRNIHPSYSYGSLAPTWKLTSFLEALYLSIFYMKPEVELYKECENPSCKRNKYFLVQTTKQNKKYCCPECANTAAQRRSRQRKLAQKEKSF